MSVAVATTRTDMEQVPGREAAHAVIGRIQQTLDWLTLFSRQLVSSQPAFAQVMHQQEEDEALAMQQTMFAYGAAVLARRLMEADGAIRTKEYHAFLALFALAGISRSKLSSLMAAAAKDTAPLRQYARQMHGLLEENTHMRRQFFLRLTRVALADGPLETAEYDVLLEIGRALDFTRAQVARMVVDAEGPMDGAPFTVLQVADAVSDKEIHKAYRERMRYCHPDRWEAKDEYSELHKLATLRAAAVNRAYHHLMKERRM